MPQDMQQIFSTCSVQCYNLGLENWRNTGLFKLIPDKVHNMIVVHCVPAKTNTGCHRAHRPPGKEQHWLSPGSLTTWQRPTLVVTVLTDHLAKNNTGCHRAHRPPGKEQHWLSPYSPTIFGIETSSSLNVQAARSAKRWYPPTKLYGVITHKAAT